MKSRYRQLIVVGLSVCIGLVLLSMLVLHHDRERVVRRKAAEMRQLLASYDGPSNTASKEMIQVPLAGEQWAVLIVEKDCPFIFRGGTLVAYKDSEGRLMFLRGSADSEGFRQAYISPSIRSLDQLRGALIGDGLRVHDFELE